MMSPSELSRLTGVSPDTLRHYERKGLLRPQRTPSGYRRYTPESLDRVRLIRRAMTVGFSLKELAGVLVEREKGGAPCRSVRALVQLKLSELDQKLRELRMLKRELQTLLCDWDEKLATTPAGKQARLLDDLATQDSLLERRLQKIRRPLGTT